MKTITIEGQLRSEYGKKATRQIRSEGQVPCVIYGGAETVSFSAPAIAFKNLVYTPDFQLAEVKLNGKVYRCVLKDLQFDVVTDELAHIDFLELVEGKHVNVTLPIKIVGQSEGVKAGGKLVVKIKALKVKALPKDLRENIEVSIDNLELNGNVRVQDVVAPNIEILNSPRIPIASVVMTRQLRQEEASADTKKK
ncbi:LSU ribosomal protein L25P [Chitinophaga sp. CF118]|uniref:50S ribosomal protein L25 n=1 Tax=Chitinophaga sp. CF118 TaxID=1884367 RepID=UPI0008EE029C|nr:50S ribosomal protein L25 [Chitinophaga sp. CF118]SFE79450.1 LSU ribosomal protein L25P [Chitinophaga sp. CF118]